MAISSHITATPSGSAYFDATLDKPLPQGVALAQKDVPSRPKRDLHSSETSSVAAQREQGNSELAALYAQALESRTPDEETTVSNIPAHSSFGQWRSQLRNVLEDKDLLAWLNKGGYTLSSLQINADGSLSVRRNYRQERFTSTNSGPWAALAGPILAALKAYAPDGITHAALYADSAPLSLIARFYGETIHNDPVQDRQRAQVLKETNAFATAGVGDERTEETLAVQKQQSANKRDLVTFQHALSRAYIGAEAYLDKQASLHDFNYKWNPAPPAYDRDKGLLSYLQSQQITLDPDSGFHLDNQPMTGKKVNLLQFMTGTGIEVPSNQDELNTLIKELSRDPQYPQLFGDLGGGLSWPTPLDTEQQTKIYDAVSYNAMNLPEFDALKLSQNAFGFLTQTVKWSEDELKEPRELILRLLQSPAAQALGKALRSRFEGAGSVEDWTLSALQIGLNQDALWNPDEKNKVAGFDLSARENWGKPLTFVLNAFTEHLRKTYGDNAPVAAYLLLSQHAPELLVRHIPDNVTYGSQAWISLKSIVAVADMRAPGVTATKTYAQLLAEDQRPITVAEKQVQALAAQEGLIHWAVADGAIDKRADNNYTDEEIEQARTLASDRFDALTTASEAQRTVLNSREELALNALEERFPPEKYGKIDFNKKAIWPAERERDLKGPYSILDIFLMPQTHTVWTSDETDVPIEKIARDLQFLPSPNEAFEKHVNEYYEGLEGAMGVSVKHMMSLLPEEDKNALQFGEFKVYGMENFSTTNDIVRTRGLKNRAHNNKEITSGSIFIHTLYEGKKMMYEINPTTGTLRRREDMKDGLTLGLQGEWKKVSTGDSKREMHTNTNIVEIEIDGQVRSSKPTLPRIQTFTSERTQHIADAVTRHFFTTEQREKVVNAAKGLTTFDTEVTEFETIQAVTRALIPGASAIHSFSQGKIGEGLTFLAFDIFGFVVGGVGALGKISKVVKVGGQLGRGGVTGRWARALIGAANPFAGGKAVLTRGLPLHLSALGKGTLTWKVISANRSVDRVYQNKPQGAVQGTENGANTPNILAQLDEITGKWYRLDPRTNQRYGMPLQAFVPQNDMS